MNHQDHVGRTETRTDTVWPLLVRGLAATLDRPDPTPVLPPLWHFMLFQDWAPTARLGADGHSRRGGLMPAVDELPRRMWAGGRVEFRAPLRVGEAVTRTSTIQSVTEKSGGSGRLVFVTVRHEIAGPAGIAIAEEQDIVYRGAEGAAVKPAPAAPPPRAGAMVREIRPDAVMLFRYSALTGNSHRIHYDLDYATRTEFYPGLIVHGPLQATLLAGLAQEAAGDEPLVRLAYRARRPAFADRTLTLVAEREGATIHISGRDETGAVCMDGEASGG